MNTNIHSPRTLQQPIVNPFPGMAALEAQLGFLLPARLGANEAIRLDDPALLGAFGPEFCELARRYPDPAATLLRQRLAQKHGVSPDEIVVDAGAVICSAGSYPTFNYFARGVGLEVIEVAYSETSVGRKVDLEALVRAAHEQKASVVYLANPDNPTGTHHDVDAIEAVINDLPARCLLLLDEAYAEFAPASPPAAVRPGVSRLRSFSKAYGLAGLRVGYAIADAPRLAIANQLRIHYAVSNVAQTAALAALNGTFSDALIEQTVALREELQVRLATCGVRHYPSSANFVTVACWSPAEAQDIQRRLWAMQIAVHRPAHQRMHDLLRITVHPRALDADFLGQFRT